MPAAKKAANPVLERLAPLDTLGVAAEKGRLRRDLRRGIITPEDVQGAIPDLPPDTAALLEDLLGEQEPPKKPLGRPPSRDTKIARHRATNATMMTEKWDAKWSLPEIHAVLIDILEALK